MRKAKTEEVVLFEESTQTVDTAGGPTSFDPALRPAHLPLKGKAFGCASRHSCSLFPVDCSLCSTLGNSANASIYQNSKYSPFTNPSTSPVWTFTQPSASGSEATTTFRPRASCSITAASVEGSLRTFSALAVTVA